MFIKIIWLCHNINVDVLLLRVTQTPESNIDASVCGIAQLQVLVHGEQHEMARLKAALLREYEDNEVSQLLVCLQSSNV